MTKIITDEKLIDKFLNRGVEQIFPSKESLKAKLLSGDRIRVYQGFDPTGPFLHIGHAMGIRALRILQQLGHEVIFLIGDYTAKIGDPDKDATRELLTDEQIEKNMLGWKEQAAQLIDFTGDNPVRFERNHTWLSKLTLEEILKLMSQTTVQQLIERDLFAKRIKENNPIGMHEFMYPLMQGYDGVAMQVDMEMGGADQTFNMLMGRHLIKTYLKKEKFVRTNQMMEAPNALTMSKTKGNGINLADSSEDMYGKAMSYPDKLITKAMELLTDIPMDEIQSIAQQITNGANPMTFKKQLAFEIVKTIKGATAAQTGQTHFEKTVQGSHIPQDIPTFSIKKLEAQGQNIFDITSILTITNLAPSSSEAKRLIQQGAIQINEQKITDTKASIKLKPNTIIKAGKRKYLK